MQQYIIATFTDSSDIQHRHVAKLKDNQTATVVNEGSKEEDSGKNEVQKLLKGLNDKLNKE